MDGTSLNVEVYKFKSVSVGTPLHSLVEINSREWSLYFNGWTVYCWTPCPDFLCTLSISCVLRCWTVAVEWKTIITRLQWREPWNSPSWTTEASSPQVSWQGLPRDSHTVDPMPGNAPGSHITQCNPLWRILLCWTGSRLTRFYSPPSTLSLETNLSELLNIQKRDWPLFGPSLMNSWPRPLPHFPQDTLYASRGSLTLVTLSSWTVSVKAGHGEECSYLERLENSSYPHLAHT